MERLIYIASTRDYNSGAYHHDGLAARFGGGAAADALAHSHMRIFEELAFSSLRQLTIELLRYVQASREEPGVFLTSWQKLEPYRVAIPLRADPIVADLFISNVRMTLGVLRYRLQKDPLGLSVALPPPSLGQGSRPVSHS